MDVVHRMFTPLLLLLTSAGPAAAQRVSFGFVGGSNLTRDFPISRTLYSDGDYAGGLTTFDLYSEGHSLLAGLSAEVYFGKGLSIEGNAVHRKLHLKQRFLFPDGSRREDGEVGVSTWQFPMLVKYRMRRVGAMRPFVEAGPAFRTRHNPAPTEPSQLGGTIGAGAEFQAGRVRISPVVRYTRWQYDGDFPRFATKRDQIELLAGINYATSVPSWKIGGRKLRFGLVGGTPLTGGLDGGRSEFERLDEHLGYIAGLAVELEVNKRWSVEGNGLYRPFRADRYSTFQAPGVPASNYAFEFTVLTWEFPVLAKYRPLDRGGVRPVVEAGPSFRLSGNRNGANPPPIGVTVGGGVEADYRALRVSPVVRYTRWAADSNRMLGGMKTRRDQVELLVSFTF